MVGLVEELRLRQRHTQHRHLQSRKPDAHRGRYAIFIQNALEHQGNDLDDRLFAGGRSLFLEFRCALAHLRGRLGHGNGGIGGNQHARSAAIEGIGLHLHRAQCLSQRHGRRWRLHRIEPGGCLNQKMLQLQHDLFRALSRHVQLRPAIGLARRGVHGTAHPLRHGRRHVHTRPAVHPLQPAGQGTIAGCRLLRARCRTGQPTLATTGRTHHPGTQRCKVRHLVIVIKAAHLFKSRDDRGNQHAFKLIEHQIELITGQARLKPLVDEGQARHLGQQNVARFKFLPLKILGALANRLQRVICLGGNGPRQARAEEPILHGLLADELKAIQLRIGQPAWPGRIAPERCRFAGAPRFRHPIDPCLPVRAVMQPGVAPALHDLVRGHLADQFGQCAIQRLVDSRKAFAQALHEALTCGGRKFPGMMVRLNWNHGTHMLAAQRGNRLRLPSRADDTHQSGIRPRHRHSDRWNRHPCAHAPWRGLRA